MRALIILLEFVFGRHTKFLFQTKEVDQFVKTFDKIVFQKWWGRDRYLVYTQTLPQQIYILESPNPSPLSLS